MMKPRAPRTAMRVVLSFAELTSPEVEDGWLCSCTYVSVHGDIEEGVAAKQDVGLGEPEEPGILHRTVGDGHLASQDWKMQMMIMRVPEMMWPRKGTTMMGFLPASGEMVWGVTGHLTAGRGKGRLRQKECPLCSLSTSGICSPGYV